MNPKRNAYLLRMLSLSSLSLLIVALLSVNASLAAPPKGGSKGSHTGTSGSHGTPHFTPKATGPAHITPHGVGPAHITPHVTHPVHPVGPMSYHHGAYSHWYHGDWHDHYHWNHPWHTGPVAWWSAGIATGVVAGAVIWDTPWRWGYWSYYNPYATPVVVVDGTSYDYSQPIVTAPVPAATGPTDDQQQDDQIADEYLDAARELFKKGDYTTAMTEVNKALAHKPNDTVPHELRALILFATKQYKQAAAAVYAVLSVGPGWDWNTLSSLYPDVSVYTAQLRDLEQYRDANLKSPEVRFLLAYHYMSCGHRDAAITELKAVVKLSPKDQLSAQILAGLTQNTSDSKPPVPGATPPVAAKPADAASLQGSWQSTRSDADSFSLDIAKDGTYVWRHTLQGKSQSFSGAYTVADGLLILKDQGNPAMIGQVTLLDANRFNFKLVGSGGSDPGLTFTKK